MAGRRAGQGARSSRLAAAREDDPELFRAEFSGAPSRTHSSEAPAEAPDGDVLPAEPTPRAIPAASSPHAAAAAAPSAGHAGEASPSVPSSSKSAGTALSHTGRPMADSRALLRLKAASRSTVATYRVRAVMRASGPQAHSKGQKAVHKRRFPRSFDRSHIDKWLIAENSGKSLQVLSLPACLPACLPPSACHPRPRASSRSHFLPQPIHPAPRGRWNPSRGQSPCPK
jgi:hypothetical protein